MANIAAGKQEKLFLGNMDAKRDWGYAGDYVEGMWLMLQQDKPGDYVLATNETHTVREFVEYAFEEAGIDRKTGKILVEVEPKFFRPAEVDLLWGNPGKAEKELGWKRKVDFRQLVAMMVESDRKMVEKGK